MGRNMSDGVSAMNGQSQMNSSNPAFNAFAMMRSINRYAFELTFPGMVKTFVDIYKTKAKSDRELEDFTLACDAAKRLAEEGKQQEALDYIEGILDGLDTAGALDAAKKDFQEVINNAYQEMLEAEANPSKGNDITKQALKEYCSMQAAMYHDSDAEMEAAWDSISKIVDKAYEKAENDKTPMELEMISCENQNLEIVRRNLNAVGIPAQVFYCQPAHDGHTFGYIVTPKLPPEARERVEGAVILANVMHKCKNIQSRETYDMMAKMAPAAGKFSENRELAGLTKAEAEFMRNSLYSDNNIEYPIGIVESPEGDGTWAVLYPKEAEQLVNKEYAVCLMTENGYGRKTNLEETLTQSVNEREKVQGMITVLSKDRGDQFIVVDTSGAARKSDDKAQMPDHFLRIEKGFVEECRATLDESTGQWKTKVVDRVDLTKPHKGITSDEIIKSRIEHLSKQPMILGEKQAAQLGITRDEFAPTEKLKTRAQKMKDPRTADLISQGNLSAEAKRELRDKIYAQRNFAKFAVGQAVKECTDAPSVENILSYIKENHDDLVEGFYNKEREKVLKMKSRGKDPQLVAKQMARAENQYKLLKDQDPDFGTKACVEQSLESINDRLVEAVYEPDNMFTADAIDSIAIDEKELFDTQRTIARARAMAETPIAHTAVQAAVQNERKQTLDDRAKNYKMMLRRKNPQISEATLETRAAAYAFTENLHDAVFNGADFAENDEITRRYGFNFGEAARNIDKEIFEAYGVHVDEIADAGNRTDLTKEQKAVLEKAKEKIDPLIRTEVVRQVKENKERDNSIEYEK